ncbi:amidohydrolase [Sporosarcina sp. E16_3]|uniref:M20 metallopeptidase family protein n=1 Tax=Sporosarcina sp. E16_3 TaxID=2789293 RepID=UPI001A92732A|nr:amidohydrolase [Sporosarcina sp. E16_3]MBO0600699.1 amidohydrolase [Sporosarcina sp. E16_3]
MLKEMLFNKIEEFMEEMIYVRRHLHMHPELSHKEIATPAFIANYLVDLGIEVRSGVGGRGVVGIIRGGKPGKTIAFRADFDALPIHDAKNASYQSTVPGVMHACGHDGHTAALLGFAKAINAVKDQVQGNIVLIHQFGEELPPGGSRAMIADGCLDGVDAIYGAHLQSTMDSGHVYVRDGYLQAGEDTINITVNGSGAHGAEPHKGADPILAASHIMVALQSIVSRNTDPLKELVISIGKFHAGDADNVIPEKAVMEGTIRVFDEELRTLASVRLADLARSIGRGLGCEVDVQIERGYDALWNHGAQMDVVRKAAADVFGSDAVVETQPIMPVEDFSYYLQHVPGAYFFVGAKMEDPKKVFPHHHEKFDFHEPAMEMIAKTFAGIVLDYQK